jgi:hypothetical protein
LCGHFAGIPALFARSAAWFGLQTTPVALLREAFARWPPWSPPSKRSVVGSAMALGFGRPAALAFLAVSRLLPGWRVPACALRHGRNLRRSAKCDVKASPRAMPRSARTAKCPILSPFPDAASLSLHL